ncbi:MAG: caspase family protein [Acetobacteraceae bacterium]|nr:caspase family protein [Acetobacteraceae bacterium]
MRKALILALAVLMLAALAALPVSAGTATKGGYTPPDLPERKPILKPTMEFKLPEVSPEATSKYAVIIGISDYYGTSSDLRYCDDDAWDVYYALTQKYGFPSGNIYMLLNSQATYANIMSAIDWLIAAENSGSVVVFYYSGHGSRKSGDPDGDGEYTDESIVPYELSRIYDGALAAKFAQFQSQQVWIAFDSCYSGGMNDSGITGPYKIDTMACRESELAGESSSVQNGFFTYLMVDRGMRQGYADSNSDGVVTVEEAFTYCSNNMGYYSSSQHPVINDQYPGSMPLN